MRSNIFKSIQTTRNKFLTFWHLLHTPGPLIWNLLRNPRLHLFVIIVVGLLPAYGIIAFASNQFRNVVQAQIYQETLQHANLISDRLESLTNQFRQILVLASLDPNIHNPSHQECSEILNNVINTYSPTMMNIGIANSNGIVICSLPEEDECINADVSKLSFYSLAIHSKEPDGSTFTLSPTEDGSSLGFTPPSYDVQSEDKGNSAPQVFVVGDYSQSLHDNRPNLGFAAPIFDSQGNVEEVVYNLIATDTLSEIIHDEGLPENSTVILLDRNNTIIGYYPEAKEWIGRPLADTDYQISPDQAEEVYTDQDKNGVERLIAYSPLMVNSLGDIKLLISVPRSAAFARLNQTLMITLLVSIFTALLVVIFIWKLGNDFFERQMRSRIQIAQRIVNGDLSAEIETNRTDDQIKLIDEFDRVIGNLKKREIEHQQAERAIRYRMARIEALSSTDIRLNAELDLQSLLQTSCAIVTETLHISACSIRLYDSDQGSFIFSTSFGLSPEIEKETVPLPESLYQRYETDDEPLFWTRTNLADLALPRDISIMVSDWIVASVRIKHDDQTIGLLFLFARDKREASIFEDKLLIKGLADRIGLSLANALLVDELRSEQKRRASLLQKMISAQEEERLRIARELHDETSQSLSAINIYMDTAALCLEEQAVPKAIQQMGMTKDVVNNMLGEVHRLISDLRPRLLDEMGLIPAISWYAEQRLAPAGITLEVHEKETGLRLPAVVETELFRISQEIITNIIRHSHATQVTITYGKEDDEVVFSVQDNGVGFDEKLIRTPQSNGYGLTGIYERVSNLGGTIQIESSNDKGTQITISIPTYQIESYV